jgi:hypothetical protein
MTLEPKTIAEQIDCLARLTGAPQTFVIQVRDLFSRKGIPLESDASPYLQALEEAFRREESIRMTAKRAQRNVRRLAENFNKIGRTYVRQLEHLKKIQTELRSQGRRVETARETLKKKAKRPAGRTERPQFMTRQVSDHMPMVPGPEEEQ